MPQPVDPKAGLEKRAQTMPELLDKASAAVMKDGATDINCGNLMKAIGSMEKLTNAILETGDAGLMQRTMGNMTASNTEQFTQAATRCSPPKPD